MTSVLERLGQVDPGYRHGPKVATPHATVILGDAILKWYDIAPADAPVPPEIDDLARHALHKGSRSGALGLAGELGFVILHRCGEDFYFLLVSSWRNDNELWETVWAKAGDEDATFRPWPREGTHRPTYCVWELGAVCHERGAWSEYLRSPRDERAKKAYLRSLCAGEV